MKRNKKLMIVVGCLIAVIGVSFAYFTATMLIGGDGSSADFTTATIQGSELRVEGNLTFNDLDIYPGHQNVSSIKVTATGDNELIPYNVIWEGTNTLNTPLYFTVYKTSSEVDVSATCEQTKGVIDGAMMYYEECSISNIDSLGTSIASGTINANETKVILAQDEFITSTASGTIMYYYVILEYPNLDENQNSDIGGTFDGKVTVEGSNAEPDINIIAAYIKQEDGSYEQVSDIPQDGYTLNTEKSVCSNGSIPSWDYNDNSLKVSSLTKSGTSCYLYFDEAGVGEVILANSTVNIGIPDFSKVATTDEGIYTTTDTNGGTTYYFRGAITNNYVYFAGYYWRIIRINGDGSVRLIYDGTSAHANGEASEDRQINTSVYNASSSYSYLVGFTYTASIQRPSIQNGGTTSTIKSVLDTWYTNNLQQYDNFIVSGTGFCNDREVRSGTTWSANSAIGYVANERISTNLPTLECSNSLDLYTTKIGLITVDEASMAGGYAGAYNTSYYLYTGQYYWTMSPHSFTTYGTTHTFMFAVYSNGYFGSADVAIAYGVRPVINISSNVQLTGSGTSTDPYVVVGAE